jgi:3-oxoacyl-[acyl-carrier-protein] synthase-3
MIEHKNIYIQAIQHYLPPRRISNQELIDLNSLKMKSSWIEGRIGITERRWALPEQAASDLAVEALRKIDMGEAPLFVSTISPDYLTPSTSSEIKRKMNWTGMEMGLDFQAACAGFIFSLELAAQRIQSGVSGKAYACATEVRSRFLDLTDRRTVFLFADAAAGCLLSNDPKDAQGQLLWTATYTQSTGTPEILVPAGGSKTPIELSQLENKDHKIRMVDGVAIEETIYKSLTDKVNENLKIHKESISDYDFVVFHQGNGTLLKNLAMQMGFREDQTHINFNIYGNSSSASLGVALSEAIELGKIKPGNKVLMVAMGAGYQLGVAALRWGK